MLYSLKSLQIILYIEKVKLKKSELSIVKNILENYKDLDDLKKMNIEDMTEFAKEIRSFMVKTVSENGGHLSSNLGVVELTLALHKVFNTEKDRIIWDVGHQSYIHKLLTGRKDKFNTLRQYKGMSGFPKRIILISRHTIVDLL